MKRTKHVLFSRLSGRIAISILGSLLLSAGYFYAYGQDKSEFPDGYDSVEAAPKSHKVIFENTLVRVLEVSLPPGTTEPYHHHRWPSFFIEFDTGGRTPHIRYHRPDGTVRDSPSENLPVLSPGHWGVSWMEPEPMHAVENADVPGDKTTPTKVPSWIRVEIKSHR